MTLSQRLQKQFTFTITITSYMYLLFVLTSGSICLFVRVLVLRASD